MSSELSYQLMLSTGFGEAVQQVKDALLEQGFGVLTEIDVRATLKKKIGEDFRPYVILGACNPPFAHQALVIEPEVGVMLPCNVTLDERTEGVLVSFANPKAMLTLGELGNNSQLREVANLVNERIVNAFNSLQE